MKKLAFSLVLVVLGLCARAHEGMWIPYLIEQLNHQEMKAMGLELSAEDIYSVNQSSIKDAIVHFNGGCTASLISDKGLLLTNHHCGYSMIQSHSSLEDNYLRDGFWAEDASAELKNPGVTASIVKSLEDVTNQVLEGHKQDMSTSQRDSLIQVNTQKLIAARNYPEGFEMEVKPFFFGNQYILIVKEKFRDIRLVGAPPSSIGKFGADTDNWMWPRHTGDFSIFRIYAGADNSPADVSDENVPYSPERHLKVSLDGVEDGDFTMVYGFPGSTLSYLPAAEVKNIAEEYNPMRIAVRDKILEILDAKMRKDEATRIKYASKYARISNSYKRWKGEIRGLARTEAVHKIREEEKAFAGKINRQESLSPYENTLAKMVLLYEERVPLNKQRYYFIEAGYYGQELLRHMLRYRKLVSMAEKDDEGEDFQNEGARLSKGLIGFYKDFDPTLEREIMKAVMPMYLKNVTAGPLPENIAELQKMSAEELNEFIDEAYEDNPVLEMEEWPLMLRNKPAKAVKKLKKSETYKLAVAMYEHYFGVLAPAVKAIDAEIDLLQGEYVEGLQKAFPNKAFYPDANSTLRISYGKVQPYEPKDAVTYYSKTYLKGVVDKYIPGDYEFDLPEKLIELYNRKDYGPYGEEDKMPVCFVATNHTTGGNSGSPVLNGKGELIGLNFDRAWDGVMSDMHFDTTICRNIMVDLRYVLFIVDKFADAEYLVNEMDLVSHKPSGEAKQEETEQEEAPAKM